MASPRTAEASREPNHRVPGRRLAPQAHVYAKLRDVALIGVAPGACIGALFALAAFIVRMHNEGAFQASSPNLSGPGLRPGLLSWVPIVIARKAGKGRAIASTGASQTAAIDGNAKAMIARTIFIEGHVQGVFFREWTLQRARELDIAGWVRNLQDGRVQIYATGEEAQIARFIDRIRDGSPASRVDTVRVKNAKVEKIKGFTRRQGV